jgi:hypothetical protein
MLFGANKKWALAHSSLPSHRRSRSRHTFTTEQNRLHLNGTSSFQGIQWLSGLSRKARRRQTDPESIFPAPTRELPGGEAIGEGILAAAPAIDNTQATLE